MKARQRALRRAVCMWQKRKFDKCYCTSAEHEPHSELFLMLGK